MFCRIKNILQDFKEDGQRPLAPTGADTWKVLMFFDKITITKRKMTILLLNTIMIMTCTAVCMKCTAVCSAHFQGYQTFSVRFEVTSVHAWDHLRARM